MLRSSRINIRRQPQEGWRERNLCLLCDRGSDLLPGANAVSCERWSEAIRKNSCAWYRFSCFPVPSAPVPLPQGLTLARGPSARLGKAYTTESSWLCLFVCLFLSYSCAVVCGRLALFFAALALIQVCAQRRATVLHRAQPAAPAVRHGVRGVLRSTGPRVPRSSAPVAGEATLIL